MGEPDSWEDYESKAAAPPGSAPQHGGAAGQANLNVNAPTFEFNPSASTYMPGGQGGYGMGYGYGQYMQGGYGAAPGGYPQGGYGGGMQQNQYYQQQQYYGQYGQYPQQGGYPQQGQYGGRGGGQGRGGQGGRGAYYGGDQRGRGGYGGQGRGGYQQQYQGQGGYEGEGYKQQQQQQQPSQPAAAAAAAPAAKPVTQKPSGPAVMKVREEAVADSEGSELTGAALMGPHGVSTHGLTHFRHITCSWTE